MTRVPAATLPPSTNKETTVRGEPAAQPPQAGAVATVYLVIAAGGATTVHLVGSDSDRQGVHDYARTHRGVVAVVPVLHDFRAVGDE